MSHSRSRTPCLILLLAALLCALPASRISAADPPCIAYTVSILGPQATLQENENRPSVNQNGAIVVTLDAVGPDFHAFRVSPPPRTLQDLGTLPTGAQSNGFGINTAGIAVGGAAAAAGSMAFFHPGPFMVGLNSPEPIATAYAINDGGLICGFIANPVSGAESPALWNTSGGFNQLPSLGSGGRARDLNNAGVIVGEASSPTGTQPVFWDGTGLHQIPLLPGTTGGGARAVNESGVMVGAMFGVADVVPFVFDATSGSLQPIVPPIFGSSVIPEMINNRGEIVGSFVLPALGQHAFYRGVGSRAIDLNDQVDASTGVTIERATGINDAGQIVGIGRTAVGNQVAVVLDPVGPRVDMALSPNLISSDGEEVVALAVTPADPDGIATDAQGRLFATVTIPGLAASTVLLSPDGFGTFRGEFSVPPNVSLSPRTGSAGIAVMDLQGNCRYQETEFFQNADLIGPLLPVREADPRTLPSFGGLVRFDAVASDFAGVATIAAETVGPEGLREFPLTEVEGMGPSAPFTPPLLSFTGEGTFGPNLTADPIVRTVFIRASDSLGNSTRLEAGVLTQSPDLTGPNIFGCSATPTSLGVQGGIVTVTAQVSDPAGVGQVFAEVQESGSVVSFFELSPTGPTTFSGTFNPGLNLSGQERVLDVGIIARDTVGNETRAPCDSVRQAPDTTGPTVQLTLTPDAMPAPAGDVQVDADVTDETGVQLVSLSVQGPGVDIVTVMSPVGGTLYRSSISLPRNPTTNVRQYAAVVTASDIFGNVSVTPPSIAAVGPNQPPVPSGLTATPSSLPAAGGRVDLALTVTDDQGVDLVEATLAIGPGAPTKVVLTRQPLDRFTGSVTLPPNTLPDEVTYDLSVRAQDIDGLSAVLSGGTVRVLGTASATGRFAVSPGQLDFGSVCVGLGRRRELTVRNTGDGPLTVWGSAPDAPYYLLVGSGGTLRQLGDERLVLPPRTRLRLLVQFSPTRRGSSSRRFRLHSDDPRRPNASIGLSGQAKSPP